MVRHAKWRRSSGGFAGGWAKKEAPGCAKALGRSAQPRGRPRLQNDAGLVRCQSALAQNNAVGGDNGSINCPVMCYGRAIDRRKYLTLAKAFLFLSLDCHPAQSPLLANANPSIPFAVVSTARRGHDYPRGGILSQAQDLHKTQSLGAQFMIRPVGLFCCLIVAMGVFETDRAAATGKPLRHAHRF